MSLCAEESANDAKLRVVIDAATTARNRTGLGVYSWELATALSRRSDTEVWSASNRADPEGTRPLPVPPSHRQLWRQLRLPREAARLDASVIHGTEYAVPLRRTTPRVATIHDVTFLKNGRILSRRGRIYFGALLRLGLRAERVIVPTLAVAKDVVSHTSYPRDRIRVVHESASSALREPSPETPDHEGRPYLLCVGYGNIRKRVVDAVRALVELPEFDLVIAGDKWGKLAGLLEQEAQRLGVADRVAIHGFREEHELRQLYQQATALVFPSLDEGFGIPPLESMALGTPVISTDVPALREVLGDAAQFVPLRSPNEIAKAAKRLLDANEAAEWSARGRAQAQKYSWQRAAAETVEVYRELA